MIIVTKIGGGASSPLTTKGDLWGFDVADNRIPIGADGEILTADSAQALGLKWAVPATPRAYLNYGFGWQGANTQGFGFGYLHLAPAGMASMPPPPSTPPDRQVGLCYEGSVREMTVYCVVAPTGNTVNFRFEINNVQIDGVNIAAGSQYGHSSWAWGTHTFVADDLLAVSCRPRIGYNQDMEEVAVIVTVEVIPI